MYSLVTVIYCAAITASTTTTGTYIFLYLYSIVYIYFVFVSVQENTYGNAIVPKYSDNNDLSILFSSIPVLSNLSIIRKYIWKIFTKYITTRGPQRPFGLICKFLLHHPSLLVTCLTLAHTYLFILLQLLLLYCYYLL